MVENEACGLDAKTNLEVLQKLEEVCST